MYVYLNVHIFMSYSIRYISFFASEPLLNFLKYAITNAQNSPQRKSYFGNFAFSKIFPIQSSKRDDYFMLQL